MDNFSAADQGLDRFLDENSDFFTGFDDGGLTMQTGNELVNPSALNLNTDFDTMLNGFSAPQEVVPALPAMPSPQNLAMGPCYHPMIGWYYPTGAPARVPPPSTIPIAGMTPAASVPTSAFASGTSTPVSAAANEPSVAVATAHARVRSKPKYGPNAYLNAQAEGRDSISTKEANFFSSNASRREARLAPKTSKSLDEAFSRRGTRPSIIQACVCDDRETERIKRPKNAFLLFRLSRADEIRKQHGTNANQVVSRQAGQMWKAAPKATKDYFYDLAEKEKKRHEAKYPTYKYQPGGNVRSKFGVEGCTCGAYELNMARFRERQAKADKPVPDPVDDDDDDDSDSDADAPDADPDTDYVPSRPRTQAPAPTAPTNVDLDIDALGLPAHQAADAKRILAVLRRKRALVIDTSDAAIESPRKRRSPRATTAHVDYADNLSSRSSSLSSIGSNIIVAPAPAAVKKSTHSQDSRARDAAFAAHVRRNLETGPAAGRKASRASTQASLRSTRSRTGRRRSLRSGGGF